jgi:hypothetical protein
VFTNGDLNKELQRAGRTPEMTQTIQENRQGRIVYTSDQRILWMLKQEDTHRYSVGKFTDLESAKSAFKNGDVKWGDWVNGPPPVPPGMR